MKIIDDRKYSNVEFGDIEIGVPFLFNDMLFVKTSDDAAVNLSLPLSPTVKTTDTLNAYFELYDAPCEKVDIDIHIKNVQ